MPRTPSLPEFNAQMELCVIQLNRLHQSIAKQQWNQIHQLAKLYENEVSKLKLLLTGVDFALAGNMVDGFGVNSDAKTSGIFIDALKYLYRKQRATMRLMAQGQDKITSEILVTNRSITKLHRVAELAK